MKPLAPVDSPDVLERFREQLNLVDIVARQLLRSMRVPVELDDLLSAGREGLLDAARRFDPSHSVPFRSYANYRVKGAIIDQVRQMAPMPRRAYERLAALETATRVSEGRAELAFSEPASALNEAEAEEALDQHLAAVVTASAIRLKIEASRTEGAEVSEQNPETAYERAELTALALRAIDGLPPTEAQVVRRYYFEGHRLEEIAKDLGVSKSWVSRLHTKAIGRLAERIKGSDDP